MPLQHLANQLVQLRRASGGTPVLVTPRHLSLRRPFFVHLVQALWDDAIESVRLEWYLGSGNGHLGGGWGGLGGHWATMQARRLARSVNQELVQRGVAEEDQPGAKSGSLEVTASIARPGSFDDAFVIGLCNETAPLPPWARPVELTGWPSSSLNAA